MTSHLLDLLGSAGPLATLLVMAVVLVETGLLVGFFLPGDSLLFGAGLLASTGVLHVPYVVLAGGVALAAFAGDQLGFTIGRRVGPKVFSRPGSRLLDPVQVERAGSLVRRYGPGGVVLARFVPVARTLVPVVAGLGDMDRRRFSIANAAGALLWSLGVVGAGFLLGGVPFVVDHVELCVLAVVVVSALPMVWHARRTHAAEADSPSVAPSCR